MKKVICILLASLVLLSCIPAFGENSTNVKTLKILFTHDIHSYFDINIGKTSDGVREHGGAARLKTLLDQNRDDNTLYLDAGDFSMGTLLQAGYVTDAYELRLLGQLGCDVTTFGNHEFDFGGYGAAQMLESALSSGDPLPALVQSNMVLSGDLTDEQQTLQSALNRYGAKEFIILNVNGLRVAVFGLLGIDAIGCSPTSGMNFDNYIEAAKKTVSAIQAEGADIIICLSHCGTDGNNPYGEDIELAKAIPAINIIVSGHTHTLYNEPVFCGSTIIASAGEYLSNLGSMTFSVSNGNITCTDYRLIPCDGQVEEDAEMKSLYAQYKQNIENSYLADEHCRYDDVICHSDFDFMPLDEMYETHQEYPVGSLIADSYIYEARRNGIDDIDVALVGLGTIRDSIHEGDITVSDAFEICSLGIGADGSAGHPILACWITGKELNLLVELDASLGPLVSSIKMSYSGLRYTFNTKRMLLDRAYDIRLVRQDGTLEKIDDKKLYKVACNMYAANMLGMLNGLSKGLLSITPKYADGSPVAADDYYACSLINQYGKEIREWTAFKNYLSSFPEKNGTPSIPEQYARPEGRKEKVSIGGLAVIAHPGLTTRLVLLLALVIALLPIVLILTRSKRKARRAAARARRSKTQANRQNK